MVESLQAHKPACRIQTERLVIRCWDPKDAPLLKDAVDRSREHLKPWMPWAHGEPEPLQAYIERLRQYRGKFDLGQDFVFGIFNQDESQVLGGCGLHTRLGEGAREIGYWIHKDFIGQGLATEANAALVKIAFEIEGVNRVEIHCDPANVRSAAIPRKLGFHLEVILKKRKNFLGKWLDSMIWTLFREDYPDSPAASIEIQAFDVMGRSLL
ncbi:N-acetyltransferase [Candidatus Parcubacteria bacterium]|nr:MAG: N-acetyltransferase [Candidatus Parcubacteria bacterium]